MKNIYILLAVLALQSCASSLEGDVYSRKEAQQTMNFQWATVQSVRPVVIEGDRTTKGQLAGAVIGGAAGHGTTNSSTQALAVAVGVVAGAIAGQMAEEKITRAQGLEISLTLDNGENIVVVQEVKDVSEFVGGERVKVISGDGKFRVAK